MFSTKSTVKGTFTVNKMNRNGKQEKRIHETLNLWEEVNVDFSNYLLKLLQKLQQDIKRVIVSRQLKVKTAKTKE